MGSRGDRRGSRLLAAAPVVLTAIAVYLPGQAAPPPAPAPALPAPLAEAAVGGLRAIEGRAPRVLIVGDSIGDQHGTHAAVALREAGVEVDLVPQWGGSLLSRDQYDMGATQPNPQAGSLMARATWQMEKFNPDLVAIYVNHNYWPPFPHDANGEPIVQGTEAFSAMAQSQMRELVHRVSQNGAEVYLVEPFPYGDVPAGANPIWASYLMLQPELGFGVIRAARVLTTPDGQAFEELVDCAGAPARIRTVDGHLTYFAAGLMGTLAARALAEILGVSLGGATAPVDEPVALLPAGLGYRMVTCDGATFEFAGDALPSFGGVALGGGRVDGDPVVAATSTALGRQGWAVTQSGVVFPLGGAEHHGDATAIGPGHHVVGIATAPHATGYWVATNAGAVQRFGAAEQLGDLAGQGEDVVAMASAPDRRGYWLLTATGRIEGFGSAQHHGDLRGVDLDDPVVGMAAHPSGQGYWVVDQTGRVLAFGAAKDLGSAAEADLIRVTEFTDDGGFVAEPVPASERPTHAVAILPTVSGEGYWVVLANGAVCHFGDARILGGLHLTEIQHMQTFFGEPLYGAEGPCSQRPEDEDDDGGPRLWAPRQVGLLG